MSEKPATLGNFIDLLNPGNDTGRRLWLQDCQNEAGEEKWEEIRGFPLSRKTVIQLAQWIANKISEEASHWSDQEPYRDTLKRGHKLLQDIHQKAVENGVEVALEEIDCPLTPTEMMVAAGLAEVSNDGRVSLSQKGEEAAKQAGQELHFGEN